MRDTLLAVSFILSLILGFALGRVGVPWWLAIPVCFLLGYGSRALASDISDVIERKAGSN